MLTTRQFRRVPIVATAILLAFVGLTATAGNAAASSARITGAASCQSDGTYKITLVPISGTAFDPSFPVTVYTKVGGATILTINTAFSPSIKADQATMVVPGNVAGTYRLHVAYIDAAGVLNTVVGDTDVAGTCTASTPVDPQPTQTPTPTPSPTRPTAPVEPTPTTPSETPTPTPTPTPSETPAPTPTPSPTASESPTQSPTVTPAPTPSPTVKGETDNPGHLAYTGADVAVPAAVGVALVAAGMATMVLSRRRRHS